MAGTKNAAVVISIDENGDIVGVTDANGKMLERIPCEKMKKLINSATKSTCQSIIVHHIVVNPHYICVYVNGRCFLKLVE